MPIAVTHSPVCSAVAWMTVDVVTFTVVGTVMVSVVPVASVSVTDVPVTDVTWPRAAVKPAAPAGGEKLGRGEAPGRGVKVPPPPNPVVAQEPFTGLLRMTVVAVSVPVASFVPVAVMHEPAVMSASVPLLVCVMVVLDASVTVESPVVPLKISVDPLICTSWPKAALPRANPPRPRADAEGDGVEPVLAAALPQATTPRQAARPTAPRKARFMRWFLPTG